MRHEITSRAACPNLAGSVDMSSQSQGGQAMHHHTSTLTDKDVLCHARSCLRRHLPLQADGSVCSTDDLLHVLLCVAVNRTTIEAACADLLATPDPETIRRYLNSQLRVEDLPALQEHLNAALADAIPAHVWAK